MTSSKQNGQRARYHERDRDPVYLQAWSSYSCLSTVLCSRGMYSWGADTTAHPSPGEYLFPSSTPSAPSSVFHVLGCFRPSAPAVWGQITEGCAGLECQGQTQRSILVLPQSWLLPYLDLTFLIFKMESLCLPPGLVLESSSMSEKLLGLESA